MAPEEGSREALTPAGGPAVGQAAAWHCLGPVGAFLVRGRRGQRRPAVLRASAAARAFGIVKGDRLMVSGLLALARQGPP